jgi:predicted ATPase
MGRMLVERDHELAQLEAARLGTGAVLLVEGSPGIGKTSLLGRARTLAGEREMCVLHARGTRLESDYAMGVVRQALGGRVRDGSDSEALFSGAAGLARAVVLEVSESVQTAPLGVLHGLHWLVRNLAERAPVLLAIDDLHWADELSLRFLAYLARRVESARVALVVATREVDGSGAVAEVLGEIHGDPGVEVAQLRPLGVEGVAAVLGEASSGSVEPEFSRVCREVSGGNPFLLTELVRMLRDEGVAFTNSQAGRIVSLAPATVARRVRLTLARVGSDARDLARAVAVLGEDVDLDAAAELAGMSLAAASDSAGELARAGVLDAGLPLRFLHPLVAGAVRADLSAPELGTLARRNVHG